MYFVNRLREGFNKKKLFLADMSANKGTSTYPNCTFVNIAVCRQETVFYFPLVQLIIQNALWCVYTITGTIFRKYCHAFLNFFFN